MNPVSITYRFRPAAKLFATSLAVFGLMTLPVAANAASAKPATSAVVHLQAAPAKPPFQFKASASVQKGLDLLKKFGLPQTVLNDLCPALGDKAEMTKVLKGLAAPKLTDAQITDFVTQAHALATDPKDPLTKAALTAFIADGMAITAANKKIPAADAAKLAEIGGKPGDKKPSQKDIQAALKVAEPTLSDADITELLFWYALGYDQVSYQEFELYVVQAELAYYEVPADQIATISEHLDDQAATDKALAALSLPADEEKALIAGYDNEVALLGKDYDKHGAAKGLNDETLSLLEADGMPLADQLACEADLAKGDTAAAEKLMTADHLTADQIKAVEADNAQCKVAAGADYEKVVTEEVTTITTSETVIEQTITTEETNTPAEPPAADQPPTE